MKAVGSPGTEKKAANRTGLGGWERTAVSGEKGTRHSGITWGRGAQNQEQEAEERT